MRPLDRNTQPGITASPPSGTNQHIILSFIKELLIHFFYFPSNGLVIRSTVPIGFDINNIIHLIHNAMSQRIVGTQNDIFVRNGCEILIQHLLRIDDRAYL